MQQSLISKVLHASKIHIAENSPNNRVYSHNIAQFIRQSIVLQRAQYIESAVHTTKYNSYQTTQSLKHSIQQNTIFKLSHNTVPKTQYSISHNKIQFLSKNTVPKTQYTTKYNS
jgi:hypothetical protein